MQQIGCFFFNHTEFNIKMILEYFKPFTLLAYYNKQPRTTHPTLSYLNITPYVLQIFLIRNLNTIEMVEGAYVNLQNSVFLLISPEMEFLILIHVLIFFTMYFCVHKQYIGWFFRF